MIKNERQYLITKEQAEKFRRALSALNNRKDGEHSQLLKAQKEAIRSQLTELQEAIREYEALKSGKRKVIEVQSLEDLPRAFIQARIALGLSQKELADRMGLKEQQIQRYEATDYASASLRRLKDVINALGIQIREEVRLPDRPLNLNALFQRLKEIGLERPFLIRRIVPHTFSYQLQKKEYKVSENQILNFADRVSRIFGWDTNTIFSGELLRLKSEVLSGLNFKMPTKVNRRRLSVYTVYAHYLALLVLDATSKLQQKPVPPTAEDVQKDIISNYASITLKNALKYIWNLGIPVVPLRDPGAFHGACWRIDGRNVIVLKQGTPSASRWLFDLLHELYHAGRQPERKQLSFIEIEYGSGDNNISREEEVASRFAGDILLDNRSEELVELCVERASGAVEFLKSVVPKVAADNRVSVDSLANYLAFRLSIQGINWWGTAENLQSTSEDPWVTARDILFEFLDFDAINELDREILTQALEKGEE